MAYGDGDRGIGGWLAFFLVTLGILSPAFGLISLAQELNDPLAARAFQEWPSLKTLEIGLIIFQVMLCWFLCYRFLRVFNWTTVRMGVGGLVVLAAAALVVQPVAAASIMGVPIGDMYRALGPAMVRPLVYSILWSSYLLVSKRVRATYGEAFHRAEVDRVFD